MSRVRTESVDCVACRPSPTAPATSASASSAAASGVSTELLRAWERRYDLLSPTRTAGGFRLYGDEDERRVRRMLQHLDSGISAAESARLALTEPDDPGPGDLAETAPRRDDRRRPAGGARPLRRCRRARGARQPARDLLGRDRAARCRAPLPRASSAGAGSAARCRSRRSTASSSLLRGRLLGLARGWGNGGSPLALLACVPGDQHDLGLICFGLALRRHGWRIAYLGPDTPLETISETAADDAARARRC